MRVMFSSELVSMVSAMAFVIFYFQMRVEVFSVEIQYDVGFDVERWKSSEFSTHVKTEKEIRFQLARGRLITVHRASAKHLIAFPL